MKSKESKRKLVFGKNTIIQLNDDMLSSLTGGSSDRTVFGDNILTRILTTK